MNTRASLATPIPNTASSSTSSLVAPALAHLAEPPTRYVDAAAMDYLVIEMVKTLRISSQVYMSKVKKIEDEMIKAGLLPQPTQPAIPNAKKGELAKEKEGKDAQRMSTGSEVSMSRLTLTTGQGKTQADLEDEELKTRLEVIGMHVGANIAERLCRDRPRFSDTLDTVKFICKEVWVVCWDKQVDNLRTNHRGVYVLQDNSFKPIARISSFEGTADALRRAKLYTVMPAGIIKGALTRLGFQAVVTPEISHLPQCVFQVKLPKSS